MKSTLLSECRRGRVRRGASRWSSWPGCRLGPQRDGRRASGETGPWVQQRIWVAIFQAVACVTAFDSVGAAFLPQWLTFTTMFTLQSSEDILLHSGRGAEESPPRVCMSLRMRIGVLAPHPAASSEPSSPLRPLCVWLPSSHPRTLCFALGAETTSPLPPRTHSRAAVRFCSVCTSAGLGLPARAPWPEYVGSAANPSQRALCSTLATPPCVVPSPASATARLSWVPARTQGPSRPAAPTTRQPPYVRSPHTCPDTPLGEDCL